MITAVKVFTEDEVPAAFELARSVQKPVLIDFWATGCKGCERMDAVTYQDPAVHACLNEHYVVVKYHTSNITKGFSNAFLTSALLWSPAFFIYAPDGAVVRNVTGYLPPRQFIMELSLGKAMLLMRRGKAAEAGGLLARLEGTAAYPALEQEALYWAGVAAFFANRKQMEALRPYWNELIARYPGSLWAERADILPVAV